MPRRRRHDGEISISFPSLIYNYKVKGLSLLALCPAELFHDLSLLRARLYGEFHPGLKIQPGF